MCKGERPIGAAKGKQTNHGLMPTPQKTHLGGAQGEGLGTQPLRKPVYGCSVDGYLALVNVAKAFMPAPRSMIIVMDTNRNTPPHPRSATYTWPRRTHTPQARHRCPLSPTLFLLYYGVLTRETLSRHPCTFSWTTLRYVPPTKHPYSIRSTIYITRPTVWASVLTQTKLNFTSGCGTTYPRP